MSSNEHDKNRILSLVISTKLAGMETSQSFHEAVKALSEDPVARKSLDILFHRAAVHSASLSDEPKGPKELRTAGEVMAALAISGSHIYPALGLTAEEIARNASALCRDPAMAETMTELAGNPCKRTLG